MNLTGGNHIRLSLNGHVNPIAVDYDPVQENIFWTERNSADTASKLIYRYSLAAANIKSKELSRGKDKFNYIPLC